MLFSIAAPAVDGPHLPCGVSARLPDPLYSDPPTIRTWQGKELAQGWVPPACVHWPARQLAFLTVLAGRFSFNGSSDGLLERFARVSAWRGIPYWSATDQRWETLVTDASAVTLPDATQRRADFSVAELKDRKDLYFVQQDNRSSGEVTYRMRLEEDDGDRFVITIENVSTVWFVVLPLFGPGDLQSTYIIERLSPTGWGYYSLLGVRVATLGSHAASYANRAAAIYSHITGVAVAPTGGGP